MITLSMQKLPYAVEHSMRDTSKYTAHKPNIYTIWYIKCGKWVRLQNEFEPYINLLWNLFGGVFKTGGCPSVYFCTSHLTVDGRI